MINVKKKEIYSLNSLKTVCCIIVILFHCPIPGILGSLVGYFLRFPVPIFFMISGYFCSYEKQCYKRRIIETIKYIIFGELFYASVGAILVLIRGGNPFDGFTFKMPFYIVIRKILFGTFFNGTLWFLYALLWTWIMFWVFSVISQKTGLKISIRVQAVIISALLFVLIFGRMICKCIMKGNEYVLIFRSSILFAVPFVWIGKYIKRFQQKLIEKFTARICLFAILGAYLLAFFEVLVTHHYFALEIFLSTVVISFFGFLLMLHFQGKRPTFLSQLGKKYSAYVYICHLACIRIVEAIGVGGVIKPILVILLSFIFAFLCYNIRKIISKAINPQRIT